MKHLMLKFSQALAICAVFLSQGLQASNNLTQAELDQMLAPVALYPDTVLTHVLIAATYPLEVVQASRWAKDNPGINAEDAVRAVEHKNWDPSVKALVAFPQLLQRLSDDLDWTQQLGEAFLADESAVLASIQQLREKAYSSGNLRDNEQIIVQRERQVIVIEPARQEIVYVPVYDTRIVYGDWWWPSHPPVYWHTTGVYYRHSPFYWGVSVNVRPWFYFGIFDWHQRHVVVHHHYYYTPPRYYPKRHKHYVDARRWHHNTEHRRGVHYRHERLNHAYNTGYGYRQTTEETQGKPIPHTRVDNTVTVRENTSQYQRKTAEQVRLTDRYAPKTPHQHNQEIRQLREQRPHNSDVARNERQMLQTEPPSKAQRQYTELRERANQPISTEQLRQREVVHQQPQRKEQQQVQTQPRQVPTRQQPAVHEQRQSASREVRQPQREVVIQRQESRAKHID